MSNIEQKSSKMESQEEVHVVDRSVDAMHHTDGGDSSVNKSQDSPTRNIITYRVYGQN